MAEFGNYVIYLIMLGAVLGALASILRPESGLGREFVNGIHAIGPVFLAQAGIMVAIPYLSKAISHALGPFFQTLGSDVSIAALSIIAVDMGGYQLADALTANRDMWITAMLVGYTSGATIVYLIPVGLTMLERKDHKYLALGAMAGLISIPFAVLAALLLITLNHIPVRELVSTGSPALHYLSLDFLDMLRLLAPLFVFCFLLAAGLKYRATAMVTGFLVFGKVMDAFIKMALALSIVQHFTGVFTKVFGGWASTRCSPTRKSCSAPSRSLATSASCWPGPSPSATCSSATASARWRSSAVTWGCPSRAPPPLSWYWRTSSPPTTCSNT